MVKDRPLRDLADRLRGHKPFTLSRWGDNEWHCLFGEQNGYMPRDGYFYFYEMQNNLWRTLNSRPPYCLGLSTEDGRAWETINACELQRLDWGLDRLAAVADDAPEVAMFVEAVRAKPLVVVGPPHFRHLKATLGYEAFVDVPPKNAYVCRDHLVRETLAALEDFKEPALVSVSAGVCAPLLIDDLFKTVGKFHQLVDFGGLWGAIKET